ncbi:MAG: DUF5777 family beta-barrel protein [Bacteroidota bacterium]
MTKTLLTVALALLSTLAFAQEDLMKLLDEEEAKKGKTEYISSTFKGTRVILGHSTKTRKKKELEFLISHRFGRLNSGAHEFFGLDDAFIRLGLEYGVTDDLNIGLGRSSFDKTFDGFIKYKLLKQSKGARNMPVSVAGFTSLAVRSSPRQEDDPSFDFDDRLTYSYQLIIARKFNPNLSLQVAPIFVRRNRVLNRLDERGIFAIGFAGRQKLTKSLAFNVEYYYQVNAVEAVGTHNSLAIGLDIETGGHVFQLHFTNSTMTVERAFVAETFDDFFNGDIHFGFNISRTFQLGSKK